MRPALPGGIEYLPITGARGLTRADMARNSLVPRVSVPVHEAGSLPLTRLHNLG